MKEANFSAGVVVLLVQVFLSGVVFAQEIRVAATGQATAVSFVEYIGNDGQVRQVPSVGTLGSQFTFAFTARKTADGKVEGQMQLADHSARNTNFGQALVIQSDVAEIDPHPTHNRPTGFPGGGKPAQRMRSSTISVRINSVAAPGWRLVNSPTFDSGELGSGDTVCFELFDAAGKLVLQWSAFVSSGDVRMP